MGNGQSAASKITLSPQEDFSVVLPEEVIAQIVAAISESVDPSDPGYKRDLASCALTCRSWSKYLRPHLFASLTLHSYADVEALLQLIASDAAIRPKVARLALHEGASERWLPRALRLLPRELPAVSSLRLSSAAPAAGRSDLPALPQIRELELVGAAFDELPAVSACVSAFPALTSLHCRGITWTRPPAGAHTSEQRESLVVVDAPGGNVPWLWALADPFGVEDRPVLAEADANVFSRLVDVAMYKSTRSTFSLVPTAGSDEPEWEISVRSATGNTATISIAPAKTQDESQNPKGTSFIQSAALRLTPAGSTVDSDARDWIRAMAQLDKAYHALPHTSPLTLDWEFIGTIEWYVAQAVKNTLLSRLYSTKRLVYHLSKGVEPPRVRYLPMALRYR
ncbi:hypothetical protein PsYK624_064970 [Phanerochaete sordida]|uniref:F-box domain-containing protein n=1 Tax=Phanerochaete sordida TaxID=48140 RepID=A0A9P3G8R1_9APHY|nr:hypothetical protein PsYK624_064970 [Phanerochaete sordida]